MNRPLIIKCPCCGVEIDIDTASGKVVRTGPKPGEPQGVERFDAALKSVKSKQKEGTTAFDKAQDALRHRESQLDDAFKNAVKKVKETDDGSKPFNPMEVD
jgi:hypothetical protein